MLPFMMTWAFGLLAVVVLVGVVAVAILVAVIYNRLVALRNRYRNAWAQIDVQLKRRYDLIPNLVEVAKRYMAHERDTLEAITRARSQAVEAEGIAAGRPGEANAMAGIITAETALTGSLGKFMARVEAYPDLKANQTMAQLMEELSSTENRVGFARQAYNDAVMRYNTACESFPHLLIARPMGFVEARLFEIELPTEREAVRVNL